MSSSQDADPNTNTNTSLQVPASASVSVSVSALASASVSALVSNELPLENSDIIADFERTPTPESTMSDIQKTVSMAHAAHNEAMKLLPLVVPMKRSRNARRRGAYKRTDLLSTSKPALLESATPLEVSLAKSVLSSTASPSKPATASASKPATPQASKPAELTNAEKVIMAVTESHRRNKARVLAEKVMPPPRSNRSHEELGHSALGQSLKILKTSASTVISASAASFGICSYFAWDRIIFPVCDLQISCDPQIAIISVQISCTALRDLQNAVISVRNLQIGRDLPLPSISLRI